MIKKVSKYLVDFIESTGFLKAQENVTMEILTFGSSIFISTIWGWITVLAICVLKDRILEGVIFIVTFSLIRSYSGGYHAPDSRRCYAVYVGVFVLTVLFEKVRNVIHILEILVILLLFLFCIYTPVGTEKNPIPKSLYRSRKIKSIIAIGILCIIYLFAKQITYKYYGLGAIFWCEIMVIIGKVQFKEEKKCLN